MDSKKIELSKYRYSLAMEALDDANSMFKKGSYRATMNRSYYAAFYAINAILALEEIGFKKHKSVVGHFNKEYVAKDIFPKELGKRVNQLKDIRETGDYTDFFVVTKEEAEVQLETIEWLIPLIKEYLTKNGLIEGQL